MYVALIVLFCYVKSIESEVECIKCDQRTTSSDKVCSNCTGDYCMLMKYQYDYSSFSNFSVNYQDCISAPIDISRGCKRNKYGNIMCICNDSDNCNDEKIVTTANISSIPIVNCSMQANLIDSWYRFDKTCSGHFCPRAKMFTETETMTCVSRKREMEYYNLGFSYDGMLLPLNSCYTVSSYVYCVFTDNRNMPLKTKAASSKKVKCTYWSFNSHNPLMRNETCTGQFCYFSGEGLGCITQSNIEGTALKVGLYQISSLVEPFYICDNDYCNFDMFNYTGKACDCPTDYVSGSKHHFNMFLCLVLLALFSFY